MKNRGIAILLAIFLGWMGGHKYYLGQVKTGLLYSIFFWTCVPAVLAIIDFIVLVFISEARFQEKYTA